MEAHRLRHLMNRGLKIVETESEERREHLYQVAGDLIEAAPTRLAKLESLLDKTQYALAKMGDDFFSSRLSIDDKTEVSEAIEHSAHPFSKSVKESASARSVASAYLHRKADLTPPLGRPGGPCSVVDRIEHNVRQPVLQENLIDEVESGLDLSNLEASRVYTLDAEMGGGMWHKMLITPHAQYRMDLRGIGVGTIQKSLGDLTTEMKRDRTLMAEVQTSAFRWVDRRRNLTIVVDSHGRDSVTIITVFWAQSATPKPPEGGCQ